ncbi:unnamed protein product [Spirodela intermedia]|uniref:Uncharacterized protein n=1 Tax=Spirodela intermedia TaxID=51605 RepID=A0A7I8KHL1_SPIIN|nr:unnamed protein product [Spirodela intermedia]
MEGEKRALVRRTNGGGGGGGKKRWFSGVELTLEKRPLKELDSEKVKREIRRWAKAVVSYARQLSGSFSGSSRRGGPTDDSRR